jgi:hypothetical protein
MKGISLGLEREEESVRFAALGAAVFVSGCATNPSVSASPPPTTYFAARYAADQSNAARQTEADYLAYVAQFYRGNGWVAGWSALNAELVKADPGLAGDLDAMAREIAAEWAKDNGVRRIDTACLQVWASALQAARREGRLAATVVLVREDAARLIAGTIVAKAVAAPRYRITP